MQAEWIDGAREYVPAGPAGLEPRDIVNAALFLASDEPSLHDRGGAVVDGGFMVI